MLLTHRDLIGLNAALGILGPAVTSTTMRLVKLPPPPARDHFSHAISGTETGGDDPGEKEQIYEHGVTPKCRSPGWV